MKWVVTAFLSIQFICCTTHFSNSQNIESRAVSRVFQIDSVKVRQANYTLIINYAADSEADCAVALRVFASADGERVDTALNSKNYIGSYVISTSCKDRFRIPLASRMSPMPRSKINCVVVPVTIDGMLINKDLSAHVQMTLE